MNQTIPDVLANEADLDELLERPTAADCEAVRQLDGELLVLGAAGKMGPSLTMRAMRAAREAGVTLRVVAVMRRGHEHAAERFRAAGIEVNEADLLDPAQLAALPDMRNVIYMAGRKFGSTGNESLTWAMNAWLPGLVAQRFAQSRLAVFSTGNVYPLTTVASGGATEDTTPAPVGEYAQSTLARERIFEYFSKEHGTPVVVLRLNYAIDMRYGVLLDIAQKVFDGRAVDLTMGAVNVIWQGEANSACLRSLSIASSPAEILNLTGTETLSVRDLAARFGRRFGVSPLFTGTEAETALLSNATKYRRLFGGPEVSVDTMVQWIAGWVLRGGATLGKPTHFETRDGKF
jgi:nucleoside-diphosphate-sugar epimerase